MTKDEMPRLACVTARADGMYSIYATVSPKKGLAARISKILASESERTGESVAAVVRRAVLNLRNFDEVTEQLDEALACNAHALEIIQVPHIDPGYDLTFLDELLAQLRNAEKALRGHPTNLIRDFVPEDSPEYKTWIEKQESAS